MAECAKCGEWYHKICLKIPSRVFAKTSVEWKCMRCSNRFKTGMTK